MYYPQEEIENSCAHCGQPFYAERSTKRYCSDSCRQLAYLERRARQMANSSFIEEAQYDIIPQPVPVHPERGDDVQEAPIELEATEEPAIQNENRDYLRRKAKRRSKHRRRALTFVKSSPQNELLEMVGRAIMKKLTQKCSSNSESSNDEDKPVKDLRNSSVSSSIESHKQESQPITQTD